MKFTFTTPKSVTEFSAASIEEAQQIAAQMSIIFLTPKDACKLTRLNDPPARINPWRAVTPQGPSTAIPIFINNLWFSPNGGRIFDINLYKATMIRNHRA